MLGRISIAPIGKFLSYGQGAYLTFMLQNFSFKARERINSEKKGFLVDNGFYTSTKVGGQEDLGRLLENLVFITLLRSGLSPNLDLFYFKTKSGQEVDFLALNAGKPSTLIQVSWALSNQKTLERELDAIAEAAIELGLTRAWIVTWQENREYTRSEVRVKVLSISDYLAGIVWED